MVGVWGLFCLVIPRLATEVASIAEPLPSHAEFARTVSQSLQKGIDGKAERETAVDAMVQDLLAKDGFANAGFMVDPAAVRGAELRAEAQWEDMVFDHHVGALNDAINRQESWVSTMGFVSPFVAMRSLSAGLCGTDYAHHRHFSDHAESWRKTFIGFLNRAFAEQSGAQGWTYKAGPELWKKAPPFNYQQPALSVAVRTHRVSLVALTLWLVLAILLALWASRRLRVV
jgi:ABC-2 type transport system permease protein